MFDKGYLTEKGIVAYRAECRFYSKKNEVSLYNFLDFRGDIEKYVVKRYIRGNMAREKAVLEILSAGGGAVPKLQFAGEDYLVLQYLDGVTMLDWLEERDKEPPWPDSVIRCVTQWALWFRHCYQLLEKSCGQPMILGDVNWRNFILADKIYGLDFEECREGKKEEDIGKLCAFALTYDPAYTHFKERMVAAIRDIFSEKLGLSSRDISMEMQKELAAIKKRRPEQDLRCGNNISGQEHSGISQG